MPKEAAEKLKNRADQIDAAVEAAVGTNQSRDSKAAQERESAPPAEKRGTGSDNSEANKRALLAQMEERAQLAESKGNSDMAAEIRARMKALEEM